MNPLEKADAFLHRVGGEHTPISLAQSPPSAIALCSAFWCFVWSFKLLALGVAVFLIASILLVLQISSYKNSVASVEHSQSVISDLRSLLATADDAETGQRGFLITGDESYLKPYNKAVQNEPAQIRSLRDSIVNNHQQTASLDRLVILNREKTRFMRETIQLRRNDQATAAVAMVRSGVGKRIMDQIRSIISHLVADETADFNLQSARSQRRLSGCYVLISLAIALAFCCCLLLAARVLQRTGDTRFNWVADTIPQLAWMAFRNGWIFWYNQRWYEYTGTSPDEMRGWGWQSVHNPRMLPDVLKRWNHSISTGQPFDMEFPLRGADGTFRTFVTRAVPVKDRKGRIFRWVGTSTDVEDFRRTVERLRTLYDSGIMGVFYWTADGSISEANDKFLEIVQYSREDLANGSVNWALMTPPEYALQDRHLLVKLAQDGVIKPIEKEYLRKDGSRVHVELGAAASGATPMDGVAFVLDITQRKRAETELTDLYQDLDRRVRVRTAELAEANQKLAESRANLYAVLNGATEIAIVSTNLDGIITVFNRGAERMLQYRADEVIGIHTPALFHSESECNERSQELTRLFAQPVRGFDVFAEPVRRMDCDEREWTYIRKDSTTLRVNLSTTAIRNADHEITGFLAVASDITARKALELELQDRNLKLEKGVQERTEKLQIALAEKTVLLKEVHHRVKNNLTVVASLLGLQADASKDDFAARSLLESQRRVHSMALIHEHLYGTRNLSRLRFDEYAETLATEVYVAFASPERITVDVRAAPIELAVDAAIPCGLILNELLSNAFKYAFPGGRSGRILISFAEDNARCICLAVEDDGVGFPDHLDTSRSETLGLKIVKILSDQLGATLEHHNGIGTHFKLTFPIVRDAPCASGVGASGLQATPQDHVK